MGMSAVTPIASQRPFSGFSVDDLDAAEAFYRDVLGLSLGHRAGDEWAEFEAGGVRLALHRTEEPTLPPSGTVVFRVPDLDEARWTMEQRGVVFDGHESEVPGFARFARGVF